MQLSRNHNSEVQLLVDAPFNGEDFKALWHYYEAQIRHAFVEFMQASPTELGGEHHTFWQEYGVEHSERVPRSHAKLLRELGAEAANTYTEDMYNAVYKKLQPELEQEETRIRAAREQAARPSRGKKIRNLASKQRESSKSAREQAAQRLAEYQQSVRETQEDDDQPRTGRNRFTVGGAIAVSSALTAGVAGSMLQSSPAQASEHAIVQAGNLHASTSEQVYGAVMETAPQLDPYKLNPHPEGLNKGTLQQYQKVRTIIEQVAAKYHLPAWLLAGQLETESNFYSDSPSGAGAKGIAQFLPDTWKEWGRDTTGKGYADPHNAHDAVDAQARYLNGLLSTVDRYITQKKLTGDRIKLALTAYNCGMNGLVSVGHIPSQAEANASSRVNSEPVTYAAKTYKKGLKYQVFISGSTSPPSTTTPHQSPPADIFSNLNLNPPIAKTPQAPESPVQPTLETSLLNALTMSATINTGGDAKSLIAAPQLPGQSPETPIAPQTPAKPSTTPSQPTKIATPKAPVANPWLPPVPSLPTQATSEQPTPPATPESAPQPQTTQPNTVPIILGNLSMNAVIGTTTPETTPNKKTGATAGNTLVWPVPGSNKVTSGYHNPDRPDHYGMDIAAKKGTPVVAVASGTVIFAREGYNGGYGNNVKLLVTDNKTLCGSSDSCTVVYAHLSEINVKEGQHVTAGTKLGKAGNTGDSEGNHLHIQVAPGSQRTTTQGPQDLNVETALAAARARDIQNNGKD